MAPGRRVWRRTALLLVLRARRGARRSRGGRLRPTRRRSRCSARALGGCRGRAVRPPRRTRLPTTTSARLLGFSRHYLMLHPRRRSPPRLLDDLAGIGPESKKSFRRIEPVSACAEAQASALFEPTPFTTAPAFAASAVQPRAVARSPLPHPPARRPGEAGPPRPRSRASSSTAPTSLRFSKARF